MYTALQTFEGQGTEPQGSLSLSVIQNTATGKMVVKDSTGKIVDTFDVTGTLDAATVNSPAFSTFETKKAIYNAKGV